MKRSIVLLGCVLLLFGGCQGGASNKSGVDVFVEGGGEFPQFLAGTWKSDKQDWQIVFEPDGTISSAVIPLGLVEVRPNRKTRVPELKGFVEAGNFQVYYNPRSRELAAGIKIKRFYLDLNVSGILKGSWEYFIVGDVSGDGKTWEGDLFNSPDITALVPDPNHPADKTKFKEGANLRFDLGDEEEEHIIFTKVPDVNAASNK